MHYRYRPQGIQAINPQALFWLFPEIEDDEEVQDDDEDFCVVTIRGPITQHGYWWDSYDSIKARIKAACDSGKSTILFKIDSPGGEVAGCFDAARSIKDMCRKAGKKLVVHVEGQCSSAAYALACVADKIVASKTADIGSIGVLAVRYDDTKNDEMSGFKVNLITSGARKADWNPHTEFTEEEKEIHQTEINELAQEFFSLVSTYRGISEKEIESMEANSYRGSGAVKVGLIDEVGSIDRVLSSLKKDKKMDEKEQEARDALRAIIDDEECSEEEKEKARKALAILEEDDGDDGDDDDDSSAQDDDDDASAQDDDDDTSAQDDDGDDNGNGDDGDDGDGDDDDDDDDDDSKTALKGVSPKTAAAITAHSAKIERRLKSVEKKFAFQKKKKLISSHGGVTPGLKKLLMSKPLSEVKSILAALPKPKKAKLGDAAKTANVASTRGADSGSNSSRLPPDKAKEMRKAMGLEKDSYGVVERGNVLMLGAKEE